MSRKFVVTGGFHLSQNFADRQKLLRVGPIVKALWRIPEEVANQLRSRNASVPAPVEGYMIVNTGFEGIGIDSDIAQELGLSTSSKAKVYGVDGESYQDTCMALLLVPVGNVNGDKAAIGVNIEAVTLPKLRMSYDAHGLLSPEGQPVRIIGILGRQFLQFATFTYNGLDGSWEMQIDESIMRPHGPNAPEAGGGQVQRPPKGEATAESSVPVFFSAERIVVAVQSRSKLYKVMQIHFSKKDGSLYVSFPYYKHRDGLVSLVTCPANIQYPTNLEMNPGGKATTHLVKYSHHPDGRTHFSQDGRVLTLVQKQSVPLTQTDGHLFTVKLQGITEFEEGERDESRPVTMKRKTVVFNFGPVSPEAIKIMGRWYSKADFMKRLVKPARTPFLAFRTEQGTLSKGILLANPFAVRGQECVMALTCEAVPLLDEHRSTSITFVGGFDPPEIVNDEAKETSFLSFTYPVTDVEGLAREIGSIDFKRDAKG